MNKDLTNKDLFEQLAHLIKKETDVVKREIYKENQKVIEHLQENIKKVQNLDKTFTNLELKCERFFRKNIIYGLEVSSGSTLLEFVLEKLQSLLQISILPTDINNIYKLKSHKLPPMKVEFISHLKKQEVLKNTRKLRGTNWTGTERVTRNINVNKAKYV